MNDQYIRISQSSPLSREVETASRRGRRRADRDRIGGLARGLQPRRSSGWRAARGDSGMTVKTELVLLVLLASTTLGVGDEPQIPAEERQWLREFYDSTGGPTWIKNDGWAAAAAAGWTAFTSSRVRQPPRSAGK